MFFLILFLWQSIPSCMYVFCISLHNHDSVDRYGEFGLWDTLCISFWTLSPIIGTLIFLLLGTACELWGILNVYNFNQEPIIPLVFIFFMFFQPFFTFIGLCTSDLDVLWVQWPTAGSFCWNFEPWNWRYNGKILFNIFFSFLAMCFFRARVTMGAQTQ